MPTTTHYHLPPRNGTQVLRASEHAGDKPGQVVRGPGWKKGAAG